MEKENKKLGLIKLTPKLVDEINTNIDERRAEIDKTFSDLVKECPYETRLAVTAHVFKCIMEHAKGHGTFRYLIYDRLGFKSDAYLPLYDAGGLTISNEFDLTK